MRRYLTFRPEDAPARRRSGPKTIAWIVIPFFHGRKVEIRYEEKLVDTAGQQAHASTFIRRRVIVLDSELQQDPEEHERILLHEFFHFVWVRLGNRRRAEWEELLRGEIAGRARGEAGWSAEWRKRELGEKDVSARTRKWREYSCESFCDTGSVVAGAESGEVTLGARRMARRAAWFEEQFPDCEFPI